jgi:hypothetical protein
MADPSPPLDAVTRAALEKLADIAVPAPVPWWPETWGWAVLGAARLALATWAIVRGWRRHAANRYRREALAELARLEAGLDEAGARSRLVDAVPPLLKRVALAAWPRAEVAALSGATWVVFLRAHAGRAGLPDAAARLLVHDQIHAVGARSATRSRRGDSPWPSRPDPAWGPPVWDQRAIARRRTPR